MTKKTTTKKNPLEIVWNDFELFSKNFLSITDNNNDVVKFELNDAQKEIGDLMKGNRFIAIGKARQSGISTFVLGRALWRALTMPNENILIVSYKSDSAKSLFDKLKTMNDMIDRKRYKGLFPTVRRDNRGELLFSNGSQITSVTAGSKSLGRGSTYTYIHLSEFAFFQNQESQLLSVEQSLGKQKNSQITIETTSNGTGNYFFKLFTQALKGESKYSAYFIPFYHKLYKKQFAYEHEQAMEWYKANNKGKRLSKDDLDEEELVLFNNNANLKMLAWRQWKILDMDSKQQFYQEFPSSPMESFISTGDALFDQSKVLQSVSHAITPLSKEDVLNQAVDFPESLLKYVGKGLDIFYLPEYGKKYYGGSDCASGSGADHSTLSIFDEDGQQILSFYNNKVAVYEFAEILNLLGRFCNYAFLCVERNSYGLPLLERLRKGYEYLNLFKQKIFDQRGQKKLQLGLTTTQTTKAIFISDLKEQFELGMIKIECVHTLQEMQIFIDDSGKMGNKRGDKNHDDSVISTALAIQAMKANKWYVD